MEIDISKEVNEAIEKEVNRQLEKQGLLAFIHTTINNRVREIFNSKVLNFKNRMCSLNGKIEGLRRSIAALKEGKGTEKTKRR